MLLGLGAGTMDAMCTSSFHCSLSHWNCCKISNWSSQSIPTSDPSYHHSVPFAPSSCSVHWIMVQMTFVCKTLLADSLRVGFFPTDLQSMMMECSDLSAPKGAKGFTKKLAMRDVHAAKPSPVTFSESRGARHWTTDANEDLSDLFTLPGIVSS